MAKEDGSAEGTNEKEVNAEDAGPPAASRDEDEDEDDVAAASGVDAGPTAAPAKGVGATVAPRGSVVVSAFSPSHKQHTP